MIDCLYNITAILKDPAATGQAYRKGGLKKRLLGIEEDTAKYVGKPDWDEYNRAETKELNLLIRQSDYTEQE